MILKVNDKNENVMNNHDFAYIVGKYMGHEAKNYYVDMLENYSAKIDYLEDYISDLEEQLEQMCSGEKVDA